MRARDSLPESPVANRVAPNSNIVDGELLRVFLHTHQVIAGGYLPVFERGWQIV